MDLENQRLMKNLDESQEQSTALLHALKVRKALASGNYARFFKLYREAPNAGKHLMDVFIDKYRTLCL